MSPAPKGARAALAACEAEIMRLQASLPLLRGAATKEADEQAARAKRQAWEREIDLGGFVACKTWPDPNPAGERYYVGAGRAGLLLCVWEVQAYRGKRMASLIHGSSPKSVELDVFRAFGLRDP